MADSDLQIREGGHLDPTIRGAPVSPSKILPFGPYFGRKIRGGAGLPGPFPGSATALCSSSVFSLAKSLELVLEISATYRLVSYLLADNWLIFRLRAQCMIYNNNFNLTQFVVVIFFKPMYNKTVIRFGFCDILNNQRIGKCSYLFRPSGRLITLTSTLSIPDITKTSSNNFKICWPQATFINLDFLN